MSGLARIVLISLLISLPTLLEAIPALNTSDSSNLQAQLPHLHQRAHFQSCDDMWIDYILGLLYRDSGPSVMRLAMNAAIASFAPTSNPNDHVRFRLHFGQSNDNDRSRFLVNLRFRDIVYEARRGRDEGRFRIVCHSDLYPSEMCNTRRQGESLVEHNTALTVNPVGDDGSIIICPGFWDIPRFHRHPEVFDQITTLLLGLSALRTVVTDAPNTDFRVNPRHNDPWHVPPDVVLLDPYTLGRFAKAAWVGEVTPADMPGGNRAVDAGEEASGATE